MKGLCLANHARLGTVRYDTAGCRPAGMQYPSNPTDDVQQFSQVYFNRTRALATDHSTIA